ncbi:hypothetical protein [Ideonella sp. B508-1]
MVAQIISWNIRLRMAARKLASALGTGKCSGD